MSVESPSGQRPSRFAGRIRLLPEVTINRIAAGEVIERPAAAVRELVENALDAGATRIGVDIERGGIDRIEVADDGIGMTPDELALAVQRHATSKLADDSLVNIATLGFRGEALPSIGAAARLAITSRPRDPANEAANHAATLRVEGGAVGEPEPSAGAPGTRVVVRDLFFATPARRKFLKSPRAEADATEGAVRRLALAAPHVAFRLTSDGRTVFDLPVQDRMARVAALFGPDAAAVLLAVEGTRGAFAVAGFVASPSVTRASQAAQALVVNGRPVADPVLRTALRVAFRDVITFGRHPVAALFLSIPSEDLDVNVHPAKAELRFRDPEGVRALVIGAVGRALAGGAGPAAPLRFSPAPGTRPFSPAPGTVYVPPASGAARPDASTLQSRPSRPGTRVPTSRVRGSPSRASRSTRRRRRAPSRPRCSRPRRPGRDRRATPVKSSRSARRSPRCSTPT